MKQVATTGTEIIPAGERGQHVIRLSEIVAADWSSLKSFETVLLVEARRRNLDISWEEETVSGDLIIRWKPTRHAE